ISSNSTEQINQFSAQPNAVVDFSLSLSLAARSPSPLPLPASYTLNLSVQLPSSNKMASSRSSTSQSSASSPAAIYGRDHCQITGHYSGAPTQWPAAAAARS